MATRKHILEGDFDDFEFKGLTHEEALAMFDETARRYLNMSGEEFLRRWKTRDFEDPDSFEVIHVSVLAPLFVEE